MTLPSHARPALRILLPPVAGFLALGAAFHLLALANRPLPLPITDADRTILHHQLDAAATAGDADVLLVGDSSCLMDVVATDLSAATGRRARNLGTFSYLGLPEFGDLVARSLAVRPAGSGTPTVVMLLHPRFLRIGVGDEAFVGLYRDLAADRAPAEPVGIAGRVSRWSGASAYRDRIETRLRPFPLRGGFGTHYGFNRDLLVHLDRQLGSALDPHTYRWDPDAPVEAIRVAPRLEVPARGWRSRLPVPVRLVVGITPLPQPAALPDADADRRAALEILREWLDADAVLGNLPAAMPADQFATVTHLNAPGRQAYTALLAAALAR